MPWKNNAVKDQREDFVRARLHGVTNMAELCRGYGISRACGYKWCRRFMAGGRANLADHSQENYGAIHQRMRWWERVEQARRKQPNWGAPKLCWLLRKTYRRGPWPAVRTVGRWLAAAGLTRPRRPRSRPGPQLQPAPARIAQAANDVWTIDFKGWFYTADRKRVCALTVRDQATRYVLAVRQVRPSEPEVAAILLALFRRYGLPRALRSDNGPPFGSKGPRGWSPLSVRWLKLGLSIEFGRPGCPQDNAAHEQMHRVLKAATARPPARTLAAQQRRFAGWRRYYNQVRPHAALGQRPPAQLYRQSPRLLPARIRPWTYPRSWQCHRLDHRGRLFWHGRQRAVGRAFAHESVGLKPLSETSVEIHLGPHLLGTLHVSDQSGLRAVRWRNPKREGLRPSLHPPHF
jgi:putative transposase